MSLTDRCNLRCTYCLPDQARFAPDRAATSELLKLTNLIAEVGGVHKIRLTGGEPTLADDLVDHVRNARALVPIVGMTTNGVLLEPMLPALRDAGLNRLNISLDALDRDAFERRARRPGLDRVIGSIRAARRLGFDPVKINAVAMQDTDYAALVRFAAWEGVHVRFIELMAIGEARPFQAAQYVPAVDMRTRIAAAGIRLQERTDRDEPTSRVWSIEGHVPAECSVGFITTTSAPFCSTCDRLRLSSQGRLHTCLMDDRGHDLLTDLRSGDEAAVRTTIRAAIAAKRPPARFVREGVMAMIGG
ncbi:MAG: radical SAM protein [Planctomycetes bacterium]|nr:radical SAM protein [Planctomycetota bacterium]